MAAEHREGSAVVKKVLLLAAGFSSLLIIAGPRASAQSSSPSPGEPSAPTTTDAPPEAAASTDTPQPDATPRVDATQPQIASTPQEVARDAYAQGEALYREGNHAEAEAAFIRSYRAVPSAPTLVRIAECRVHEGLGPEAVEVFERYLGVAPDAPDADAIRRRIEELRASPGILRIATTPEGARVLVDGVARERVTPLDVEVAPGSHVVRVELEGYVPMEGTFEVGFASVRSVNATLEAAAPPDEPADELVSAPELAPVPRRMTRPVWATAVTGGVLAVGGAVLGFSAVKAQGEFDRHPTEALATRGERTALAADLCFGAAAASVVTSILLYFRQDTDAPPRVSVSPVVTPSSAAVQAGVRF